MFWRLHDGVGYKWTFDCKETMAIPYIAEETYINRTPVPSNYPELEVHVGDYSCPPPPPRPNQGGGGTLELGRGVLLEISYTCRTHESMTIPFHYTKIAKMLWKYANFATHECTKIPRNPTDVNGTSLCPPPHVLIFVQSMPPPPPPPPDRCKEKNLSNHTCMFKDRTVTKHAI